MMSIGAMTRVKRRDTVLSANIGDDLVLMSVSRGTYCGVDQIGADIWARLAEPTPVRALCESLVLEYEADPATIERDVIALLNRMAEQHLIEESD